ncbi:1214_t:CDS:2 [Cetraspora pellucida]|uniref:1214_t:CDS:1 n=1 Tax=Cetraspora pellucida TaxID=1433469 RepID=A0ACA9MC60_9GLOM|nr:1214_t:CDS:2 [Cetraspora pellucida]
MPNTTHQPTKKNDNSAMNCKKKNWLVNERKKIQQKKFYTYQYGIKHQRKAPTYDYFTSIQTEAPIYDDDFKVGVNIRRFQEAASTKVKYQCNDSKMTPSSNKTGPEPHPDWGRWGPWDRFLSVLVIITVTLVTPNQIDRSDMM